MGGDDVVVLLSSDDEGPFVTPHPPSRVATNPRPTAASPTRRSPVVGKSTAIPSVAASTQLRKSSKHFGFLDSLSSDDLSSPFPTLSRSQHPKPLPTDTQLHVKANPNNAIIILDDGEDEDNSLPQHSDLDTGGQDVSIEARPSKRQRLTESQYAASFTLDFDTGNKDLPQPSNRDWWLPDEEPELDTGSSDNSRIVDAGLPWTFDDVPSNVAGHKEQRKGPDTVLILSSSSPPRDGNLLPTKDPDTNDAGHTRRLSARSLDSVWSASSGKSKQPTRLHTLPRGNSRGNDFFFLDGDDEQGDFDSSSDFGDVNQLLAAWRQPPDGQQPPPTSSNGADGTTRPRSRVKTNDSTSIGQSRKRQAGRGDMGKEELRKIKEAERKKRQEEKEEERQKKRSAAEAARAKKKEEKAATAAFNEANKSRTDKSVATPEMIVQLPSTLSETARGALETCLKEIGAEMHTWTGPVDNVVIWRRKVNTEYKPDLGYWMPVPLRIEEENHALVILPGDAFVQLILDRDESGLRRLNDLDAHVRSMRRHFSRHKLIYLIEGMDAWRSKNRLARNRQFASAVRSAGSVNQDSAKTNPRADRVTGRAGGRQAPQQPIDEVVVDDALLELQMTHDVLIHETKHPVDTARWIKTFTEQIATAPYRQQKEQLYAAAAAFCMDSGQIATGDGATDTYALVLQQIGRVTEPVALGVAARFDSIPKLVQGLKEEGPLALEACLKSRNRNGALSDRTVGPALSKRIHSVLVGQNERSTNV